MSKWYSTEILPISKPMLSKEEFVRLYLPQYAKHYTPPSGIKMVQGVRGNWHVQMTTPGSIKSQLTKRQNRIDAEFELYRQSKEYQMETDRKHTEPTLL